MTLSTTESGATWGLDRIDQRAPSLSGTYTYTPTGEGVKWRGRRRGRERLYALRDTRFRHVCFLARWPSRQAMQRARERVRELTARDRLRWPVKPVVQDLNRFLRGWAGYFRDTSSAGAAAAWTSFFAGSFPSLPAIHPIAGSGGDSSHTKLRRAMAPRSRSPA